VNEVEIGVLAARLLCLSALVFLAPGLGFLSFLRVRAEWPERVVLAFSLSYAWVFILSVILPLGGWTVVHAAVATALLVSGFTVAVLRRWWRSRSGIPAARRPLATGIVIALVLVASLAGWIAESPFTGEEALDFASLSRFADGGPITLDNTALLPDTLPVYLFQPYQLALGMISRWSGMDPLVAFVKFRAFLVPLCLLCVYALLRRLTLTRVEAVAAFVIVVLFVALEIETWERNALFPFVRRQGFSIAVLMPTLLVLCIVATRRVQEDGERLLRRVALCVMPVMLAASLSTHAIEMVPGLFYAVTTMGAIVTGLDRGGDRKAAIVMVVALAVSAGTYMLVHSQAVSYIAEPANNRRIALGERLDRVVTTTGETPEWATLTGDNLFVGASPLTTAAVLGIPAMGLAALRAPTAAAGLALGTVPLALLYANPMGSVVLRWLVSPGTMRDTSAYFMFVGVLGVALGLMALAQAILNGASAPGRKLQQVLVGSFVLILVLIAGREAIPWLGSRASTDPRLFLVVQAAIGAVVVAIAAVRSGPLVQAARSSGFMILAVCLAVPLAVPGLAFGGAFEREANDSVFTRFNDAASRPSSLDWPEYYSELAQTIRPQLPVPRAVVDELRRRIPPRQVILAHPSYSCALVVLMDAYCINPESIYGDYFRPATRYHTEYVRVTDGQAPEHPFFNTHSSLSDLENRLLREYRVSYLLADPEHADLIGRKLEHATIGVSIETEIHGYRLYKIDGL
jgi:hypothetical protein